MTILRLTASLSIALLAPLLPGVALSQATLQNQMSNATGAPSSATIAQVTSGQVTTGQTTGTGQSSYTSPNTTNFQTPGTNLQTPGANLSAPGAAPTTSNVQSTGDSQSSPSTTTGTTGVTQTTNGQSIGPSLPSSTKVPGADQTFVNGQSTGTTQVAPPLNTGTTQTPINGQPIGGQTAPSGTSGTQTGSGSVINPPQIIQGSGVAPAAQPTTGNVPAANTAPAPTQSAPTQSAPNRAATGTIAPNARQAAPTQQQGQQGQQGQGSLDAALQQATCAQDWGRAIRLVNTAIAAAPTKQAGYRSQLTSYRSRLQNLQAKRVQAPNWAQQCRSSAATGAGQ